MLRQNASEASLAEELPYWDFCATPFSHAILMDGSLVSGLHVPLKDIECADDNEVNQFTHVLRSALNSLSEVTTVQFHFTVRSNYADVINAHENGRSDKAHPLVQSIAEYREKALRFAMCEQELYRPKLYVFLKTSPIRTKKTGFLKKAEVFSDKASEAYDETLEVLSQNIDTLKSSFNSAGVQVRDLSRDELISQCYRFLNPKRSQTDSQPAVFTPSTPDIDKALLEEADWMANQSPREQLIFGDLILGFEHFVLDSYYHKVITLKTLPEVTVAGQLDSFLRLPFHYDLTLSFDVPPQASEMAKLQQKRKMAHSLAVTQGGRASDLESESKLSSTEELIRELLNTGQRIYSAQLNIILRAPNTPDGAKILDRQSREVLSRFRALQGAEGLGETVGAWKIVKGNLPAAPISLERARKMKTNNLADFLPVYGPREGDADPVVVFRNRQNGLVKYDTFDPGLPNYNILVTGSSGAGKSFLNNCILLQELARGLRVFIIDIGGSYRKLTEGLDGQYIDVNLSDNYTINPFHIANPECEPSGEKLKSVLAVIESMVIEDQSSALPKLDRVLLEKTIVDLYERKRLQREVPILSELAMDLAQSEEPSMKAISKMLYSWTGKRPYGRLLDGQGSLRTDSLICTFDLKGLSSYPDLQRVMILILMDFIMGEIEKDKTIRKRIVIDEAWELLKSPIAAERMEGCARKLRKENAGITFLTQGLDELLASPAGRPILNCTSTKLLLLQRGDLAQVGQSIGLSQHQIDLVRSLQRKKGEYSEALLIEGDHRQVIRISPSPIEYWLSTSDSQDNNALNLLREEGRTLVSAIEKAAELYPTGVANAVLEIK